MDWQCSSRLRRSPPIGTALRPGTGRSPPEIHCLTRVGSIDQPGSLENILRKVSPSPALEGVKVGAVHEARGNAGPKTNKTITKKSPA
jgi:hypothetical protein